jgi:hypothetical protein
MKKKKKNSSIIHKALPKTIVYTDFKLPLRETLIKQGDVFNLIMRESIFTTLR